MRMIELLSDALETEAAHNLFDHFVLTKLKKSRDMCVQERERLDKVKEYRGLLLHEEEDWECQVLDIAAFNRVIDYYGG